MPPRVSIITVCRNEAARIRKTAESVVGQTSSDFEWIVKDGGSTDGTLAVLGEYRSRMAQFVSSPDGGVYEAMNEAARSARGEWLLFLNGGDALAGPTVLEQVLPRLADRGEGVFVGECLCVWPDGRPPCRKGHAGPLDRHYFYRQTVNHQSAFIGRRVFERFGPYDVSFRLLADYDLFVRSVLGGTLFGTVPTVVAEYDMSGMSARMKHGKTMRVERRRIRRRYSAAYRVRRFLNDGFVACRNALVARTPGTQETSIHDAKA